MARNKYNVDEELNAPFNWPQLKRGISYVIPYKRNLLISFSCAVAAISLGLLGPVFTQYIVDVLIPQKRVGELLSLGAGFAAVLLAIVVCNRIRARRNVITSQSVVADIRRDVFTHLQKLPFDYYDSRPHGKILVRVVNYVNSVADFLSNGLLNSVLELIALVIITIYMFAVSAKLALVVLSGLPLFLVYVFLVKPHQRRLWQRFSNKQSNTTAYLAENMNGAKVTQAFSREAFNEGIFNGLLTESRTLYMRAVYLIHGLWPITAVLNRLVIGAIYITGIYLFRDEVSPGIVIAMVSFASRFWGPIQQLGNIYNQLMTAVAYLERIFQVLDEPITVSDQVGAVSLPLIAGRVEFDHVTFAYEAGRPVLKDVSFAVAPGESIALVGPTGAGKSTVINLLSRFYNVVDGKVLLDGHDISGVTLSSLRRQMGIMLQDTFIFSGDYMENIRYGRLDATDDECIRAARAVHASEFIERLPQKYKTAINERGEGMSAGQRQLLSFARTLLSDPKILILDEATSSIDTHTELLVQEGIAKLLEGRTSFIVAHRLSTIKNCTRIMYIEDGKISECGSHSELISLCGKYYKLYMSQIDDALVSDVQAHVF